MPLTDTAIRSAKPGEKPIKLFDGGGLYPTAQPERIPLVALRLPLCR
ncbi:MAG: hypothetical protein USCGTAYLOR_02964 [Chromatiales bacterium USCg_Taylor]|nr:MAG: hypothetical protein USCGTAYLOR_02964 [Chromatiales bacterium USCg_Taylor]